MTQPPYDPEKVIERLSMQVAELIRVTTVQGVMLEEAHATIDRMNATLAETEQKQSGG